MLSIQLDANDVKTLVENIPGATVGVEYKDKQFHVAHSSGASVVIKLEKDPEREGRLLLYAPWSKMKWVGLPGGWTVRKGWDLVEAKVVERLRDELDARGIPREIVILAKKDPYFEVVDGKKVKKSGYLGFSIDYMLLRSHVLTFMIQGNMISFGKISLTPDSITIGFTIEAAPAVLTRESDDDYDDYDDEDDDGYDDDDEVIEEDD